MLSSSSSQRSQKNAFPNFVQNKILLVVIAIITSFVIVQFDTINNMIFVVIQLDVIENKKNEEIASTDHDKSSSGFVVDNTTKGQKTATVDDQASDGLRVTTTVDDKSSSGFVVDPCSNGNCDLAYTDSYGFFDDITNQAWLHKKFITTKLFPSWYRYPNNPNRNHNSRTAHWLGFNVHPIFTCDFITRVGGYGDGAKWVCDVHRLARKKDCLIYSIGSNGQYEFEDGIQETIYLSAQHDNNNTRDENRYPCEIHIFDPSPNYKASSDKNMYYHPWGITSALPTSLMDRADRTQLQFYTLEETFQKLNHTNRNVDIFKIDCEGCEWSAYSDMLRHSDHMTQILIEIHPGEARPHDLTNSKFFDDFRRNHWIPYYRESNPWGPTVYEFCFLRLKNFYPDVDKQK